MITKLIKTLIKKLVRIIFIIKLTLIIINNNKTNSNYDCSNNKTQRLRPKTITEKI